MNLWGQLGWLCHMFPIPMTQSVPHDSHPFGPAGFPGAWSHHGRGTEDIRKYGSPPQDKA